MRSVGQDLLNVPMGKMIQSMGLAIAEAQYSLDEIGMRLAQMMSGEYEIEVYDPDKEEIVAEKKTSYVTFDGEKLSLLELGFTPTFYQFTDTIIEVKVSISMSMEVEKSLSRTTKTKTAAVGFFPGFVGTGMRSASVNASYSSKYQYSAEGSSLLRTKLSPVPPPAVLEERIRAIVERKKEEAAEE